MSESAAKPAFVIRWAPIKDIAASSVCCMQESALDLVEQAQSNNGAYLILRSVALQPPDLVINAGPSACLHGWLDLPPTPSDGGLMVSQGGLGDMLRRGNYNASENPSPDTCTSQLSAFCLMTKASGMVWPQQGQRSPGN